MEARLIVEQNKEKIYPQVLSLDDNTFVGDQECREELSVWDTYFQENNEQYNDMLMSTIMKLIGEELKRLPESQRDVIIRFYFYSESDGIIAKNLSRNKRSILDRRHRAIATLRKRLIDNPYISDIIEKLKTPITPTNYIQMVDFIEDFLSIK